MSDLEEENREHSVWLDASEWSEDQLGVFSDCDREQICCARRIYEAIQTPGELNTRVRAAIESARKQK